MNELRCYVYAKVSCRKVLICNPVVTYKYEFGHDKIEEKFIG